MDTLVIAVISALAGGYVVEVIGTLLERFTVWDYRILQQILAPFAVAGCAVLFGVTDWSLIPIGLCGGFLYLLIMKLIARPVQIQQVLSSRRPSGV